MPMTFTKVVPKVLVPHMPDVKNPFDVHQSEKIIQFNRPPLANEIPKSLFGFSTKMEENPFMLSQSGRYNTDFYRGLPVPVLDIKEISTFDVIKTKSVDTFLGHPALGVMVKVNGQVQMASGVPTAPVVPVGGKNRLVVTLMPLPGVGLKSIKTTLNIRQQDFASTAKPAWNPLYDQLLGYNVNNIVGRLNENVPMDFGKTDKKGFSTQLIVQGIRDSNQEVAMQGVFSWIRGMDGKFVKIAAEFISPHPQISYQTCLYGHAEYPSDYNTWTLTPGINKPITGRFELSFGKTCSSPDATKIKAAFTGDKSPMQIHLEKNDYYTVEGTVIPQVISKTVEPLARSMKPVYRECENDRKRGVWFSSACQAVKDIYSTLMQMKIDIDYQNIPYGLEKLLSKAENLVHSMYFWNSEIDDVRVKNTPNKLTILVDFTSADERVDLVYSTPQKNAKLLNMPVSYPVAPISADQKPMDFWEMVFGEDLDEMCTVMGEELNTLDSAEIRVPFSECYHLLAKDCSVEEAWSVMYASAGSRYGESKKVMAFIGGKKIEMIPAESITSRLGTGADMIIRVDGRVISGSAMTNLLLDDEELDITIETQGNGLAPYYKISAEQYGIEFWFDGHNIALKPTFWLRNQICGLCGNNNGEKWDDMMLPSGKFADSIPDLMRGYMVAKDGCGQELKDISRMNRMSLFPASSFENSKLLVQNLAMSENEMIRIAAQHMGTALTSNSASPLNLILSVADLNRYMLDLLSGKVISGSECLARSVELANVVGNLKMQAGSVLGSNVFGPVTPERKYQTVVQRMGSAVIAVLQAAAENPSAANTDKYMQIIVKLANNIHRIQGVVARQDSSLECLEASKAAAVILQSVRASLSDSGDCDKLKNIVRTKPGQVCFSLEALPDCPELCPMDDQDNSEEDFALFKRVAFHCLPEESTVAQRLLREVDTRVLTEISQKPANDYFSVPKPGSCSMSNSSLHRMSRKERLMWV